MASRILVSVFRAPPDYGGAGRQALNLAVQIAERGFTVSLITAHLTKITAKEEMYGGVKIHRIPVLGNNRLRAVIFGIIGAWHLLMNKSSYDIVHVHGAFLHSVPLIVLATMLHKPVIIKLTSMGYDDPLTIRHRRFGGLLKRGLKNAKRIIAVSDELVHACIEAGFEDSQIIQIPNGVDTDVFKPVSETEKLIIRSKNGFPNKVPIVIYVGAVRPLKGSDILMRSWMQLHRQVPEAQLLLIGPVESFNKIDRGEFVGQFKDRVGSGPTKNNVHFIGQQNNVQCYYQLADQFVLPSLTEGMANSLLEAMSCKLPVVATSISGSIQVVVDNINGLLVSPGDEKALSESIIRLIQEPELSKRLGKEARKTIQSRYSLKSVATKYVALYEELLE